MAPIRRPLGNFHQQFRRRCDIVSAKQTPSLLTVGGCAAYVATATRILASPFRRYYKYGASHRPTESEPRFVLLMMVAGPAGVETSVRKERPGPCARG
jgi:hypothetical protein